MKTLIKGVQLREEKVDILINNNKIDQVSTTIDSYADEIIDGKNKAAVPGFFNAHTHAAMTLMRGYADDMKLMEWLENEIWPLEAALTKEDVYWGTRLACTEMIKSGTTCFIDMYYHFQEVAKAVQDAGIRAVAASVIFDNFDESIKKTIPAKVESDFEKASQFPNVAFSLAPHAIYTVSSDTLKWVNKFSEKNNLPVHLHLSETEFEVEECKRNYGATPVEYLKNIGVLSDKVIAAHCLHLTDDDIKILADYEVKIVHNPISNMKLASGNDFRYMDLRDAGVKIAIGTDGTSSNNNLDMLESVKIAALNQKDKNSDPTIFTAEDGIKLLTETAESFTGLKTGKIESGYLADINLVNLFRADMLPNHNYISNLIYSANGAAVDTVICNGKILMQDCQVPDEEKIYTNFQNTVDNLLKRKKKR